MSDEAVPDAAASDRRLGPAIVSISLTGSIIGSVGAPLIVPVARDLGVSLSASQWTLTVGLFAGALVAPILARLGAGARRRTTILTALGLMCLGGMLTTVPLPFAVLLFGRALQGFGLGVTGLLMSVVRDHLPVERARSTIAMVSVAGTVGAGVGYPLIGLVDQVAGLRAAYGLGLALSVVAAVIAWRVVPTDDPIERRPRVDVRGAALFGVGIIGVLLVVAEPALWRHPWVAVVVLAAAVAVLVVWVVVELHTDEPLVKVRVLRIAPILGANAAMLLVGVAMYLLFSSLTRYVQTPSGTSYGFSLGGVAAGACLIPFSALGFVAGRLVPRLNRRTSESVVFAGFSSAVIAAAVVFALTANSLAGVLISMSFLGFGVGGVSAVMPPLLLPRTPPSETASVLSINQISRSVGFSIGSAVAGMILARFTVSGALVPEQHGYAVAALCAIPFLAVGAGIVFGSRRARSGDRL